MFNLKQTVMALSAVTLLSAAPALSPAFAAEQADRFVRLSFSDGRPDVAGMEAVNQHLLKVGVRIFEADIPDGIRPVLATSRTRALDAAEQTEVLSAFALDRAALLDTLKQAGRTEAVANGGELSISEDGVPPYPKVYDMKAMDEKTVAYVQRKFGRLHVNSADSGHGIDEVMTIVSGGPYTWFFVLDNGAVGKVRFSEVKDGHNAWRISYPGLVPHGGFFDAEQGLVVAFAHGPKTFVMRYSAPGIPFANTLNDNPWVDFAPARPQLLDQARPVSGHN